MWVLMGLSFGGASSEHVGLGVISYRHSFSWQPREVQEAALSHSQGWGGLEGRQLTRRPSAVSVQAGIKPRSPEPCSLDPGRDGDDLIPFEK